jgi:cation-transporting P-type ATPase E
MWILGIVARPLTPARVLLLGTMAGTFVAALGLPPVRTFFALELGGSDGLLTAASVALAGVALLELGWRLAGARQGPTQDQPAYSS